MLLHQPNDFPRAPMASGLCCVKKSPSCCALRVLTAASAALVPIPTSPPPLRVKIWELWWKRNEQDLLLQNAGKEEDAAAGLQAGWLRALHRGSTSCLFLMAPGTPGSGANCTSQSYCQRFLPSNTLLLCSLRLCPGSLSYWALADLAAGSVFASPSHSQQC